jgi:hypothetical protein
MTGPLYPPFYPPAYPYADPPPPPVPEQLTVNGVDLGSYAYMTTDVSGLLTVPALRGEDVVVPGRHGRIRTEGKRFDANEIVLPMWVVGSRPDGLIPGGGMEREFYRRRDDLLQLFHADEVELAFRRPDGLVLTAGAQVVDVMDFTRRYAEPLAMVSVALRLTDPFWVDATDVAQAITGVTGTTATLTLFDGSTAPIADARITFHGPVSNPRLAVGDRWVQYNGVVAAGRELVLECGHWRASAGAGAAWSPDERQVYREPGPAWFEFPPSRTPLTATFIHTGGGSASVEIAGRRKFLSI